MSQHHVYPVAGRAHDVTLTGIRCWCRPRLRNRCPECEDCSRPAAGCHQCRGTGLVDAVCDSQPDMVIHNEESHT